MRRNYSIIAIRKFLINFSAAFEREHDVSFLAARMADVVKDIISSDFLTDNSPQIYQHYIRVAKFLFRRPKFF